MARRKSAKELQLQLKYAQAREAYQPPEREQGSTTRRLPKIALAYGAMISETRTKYKVQASKEAVLFFTQAALNLTDVTSEGPLARGSQPAKVHATVADTTPTLVRAEGSKRPYIRYGKGARDSNVQYTYSAPFSVTTIGSLDTELKALFTSVKGKLGGAYGRVWYTPEYFVISDGGE
ncbi:hypothetical protein [Calothrix sp. CCY 0018]|uniref:hypothetical protein n=1 Tax=Calothrix sp. CCY 0018 TaxID=3103864 RepID=UPI0039C5BF29